MYLQIFHAMDCFVGTGQNLGRRYYRVSGQGASCVKKEQVVAANNDKDKNEEDWIHTDVTFLPDIIVE